ncbi:MAG: sodium:solute symporter family protein [Clostridiales bacterium]|nr:sodium:solute symporter family protein [Clostridiales bacterium]
MLLKIIITIVYLAIVAFLGVIGYKNTKNTKDFLLGGRNIHPAIMALSYGATFISTSAIVGFGGTAGVFGFSLLWLTFLNIFLGVFIAFTVFGKRTRKMGHNIQAHTFPEFMGKRYESKLVQKFSGGMIFIFMPVYTAAVMIGASKFLETGFNMDYNVALLVFAAIVAAYVFFGGIKGVMYSDAFQGTIMLVGMTILLVTVYSKLGGVTEAHTKLTDLMKNAAVMEQTAGLAKGGFTGWTSMPEFFSKYWWIVVSSITLGVGIGVLAQPQLAVRFMTVKSDKELNRAIPIGGIFILLMTGVAFLVGSMSNIFFFEKTGKIAVAASGGTDGIIPNFLDSFMPEWFVAIFLIVLLAAGMSTISSQLHTVGTAVSRDLFNTEKMEEKKSMLISRLGVLVAIVMTIVLAYVLPTVWDGAIAISTGLFFGLCGASFLPMYVGALYFPKLSKTAALSGMFSGFGASLLWMMFFHSKESVVLKACQAIFGKPTLAPEGTMIQFVDPIVIALTLSILVTVIVGLATKSKYEQKHIDECFEGIGK